MDRKAVVLIEWEDPHSVDEWIETTDQVLKGLPKIITVGQLIREEKTYVIVSLNWDAENDKVSCTMVIPKKCIKKMRRLKQ